MMMMLDEQDRQHAYAAFLDDVRTVAREGDVGFAAALAVDLVESALDETLGPCRPADDRPWCRLVHAVNCLLATNVAAHRLPAGTRLERFVEENADLLGAA